MVAVEWHSDKTVEESTYALLGAASFLGGAMRATVSLCVILMELTNNLQLLPQLMMVLLVAKFTGDTVGIRAIYDLYITMRGYPYLHLSPDADMPRA